jgi:hypothetical protein
VPYRTLHEGAVTQENEAALLKKAGKECVGLEREFLFVFDCEKDREKEKDSLLSELYSERVNHIFEKWMKGHDRLSIIKFNCKEGMKIECNLTPKENNETLLAKALQEAVRERNEFSSLHNFLSEALLRSIWRVKSLSKEKVIVLFLKSLDHYQQRAKQKSRLVRRKNSYFCHADGKGGLEGSSGSDA